MRQVTPDMPLQNEMITIRSYLGSDEMVPTPVRCHKCTVHDVDVTGE